MCEREGERDGLCMFFVLFVFSFCFSLIFSRCSFLFCLPLLRCICSNIPTRFFFSSFSSSTSPPPHNTSFTVSCITTSVPIHLLSTLQLFHFFWLSLPAMLCLALPLLCFYFFFLTLPFSLNVLGLVFFSPLITYISRHVYKRDLFAIFLVRPTHYPPPHYYHHHRYHHTHGTIAHADPKREGIIIMLYCRRTVLHTYARTYTCVSHPSSLSFFLSFCHSIPTTGKIRVHTGSIYSTYDDNIAQTEKTGKTQERKKHTHTHIYG